MSRQRAKVIQRKIDEHVLAVDYACPMAPKLKDEVFCAQMRGIERV